MEAFDIKGHINFHVNVVDNLQTPVDANILKDVIETFHNRSGFYLEIIYKLDFQNTIKIVTPYVRNIDVCN